LPAFALALNEFATADYAGLFLLYGLVCNPAWAWVDGPIYASTTPGGLTQTAPSETGWVQSVGVSYGADGADYMLFSPMWIKELGERAQLPLTIDVDDTEALLVRKDGDAGDVFVVDTINNKVVIGTGAPGIRIVKLTGTAPAEGGSSTTAHGLDKTKIISATVLVANNSGNPIPPNFKSVNDHEFDFFIDTTNVHVYCKAANSASIDGNAVTILIIYEE